ncbi:MAG: bifunctional histidinol-phosphatase/imidazoleglycerol-phosphate dehydratase HisB [bacterium]|nr:bifunctional histidinol-phosphatase/imidazoleglycerol-phosphate dehydratase HisB [bacterium]MDI1337108.1 bifunctional histidinol-phosphatase/imidazoleglycerol-phosphate dehydratase HisB [Lacunisphaera sp.]
MSKKILFIDRDGTLIMEPFDQQIDRLDKFALAPDCVPALLRLRDAGWKFVMVTNQDGLGTPSFREEEFKPLQKLLIDILASQGIAFEAVRVCPHTAADRCDCRKPKTGLLTDYLKATDWSRALSAVIGDRETDVQLAQNLGIRGLRYDPKTLGWAEIARRLVDAPRRATIVRNTKETKITVSVDLDNAAPAQLATGIGFFDHMLEQIAKNAGIGLAIKCDGDLEIDEHHTVEDVGIALGLALKQALGDKRGVGRYGFVLPMDEAQAQVALDLSGRAYFTFEGKFPRDVVGELPTELVPHFFRSVSDSLLATLQMSVRGDNTHHMVETLFKGFGRALRPALARGAGSEIPSTKGVL